MTYLVPSKISKDQVGRLAIVEVIEGNLIKIKASRSSILGPEGDKISVAYGVFDGDTEVTSTG